MTLPVTISAACFDGEVWIHVEGRGNFQGSAPLKKFVQAMILRGYRDFVIDLATCDHMDSTFMGTLTGISQNLRELGQGSLRALNANPRNVELFANLGLDMLFGVEAAGEVPVRPAEQGAKLLQLPMEAGPERDIVLSAHEALIAANPANADRFRDVLAYLKGG
jgi:anti-anti-sigma regulatory factor